MKRAVSKKILEKEATFWNAMKKAIKETPVQTCRK